MTRLQIASTVRGHRPVWGGGAVLARVVVLAGVAAVLSPFAAGAWSMLVGGR